MLLKKLCFLKNLYNKKIPVICGAGTFIDPDVVIDSPKSVTIGSNCTIRKGVVLRPEDGEIAIGDNCVINHYCVLHGKGGIYIGDWTIIAPHCGIYAQNHSYDNFDIPITKQENSGKGIYIMGDNWISAHSVICDDVTLGKGCVVGANSTVTKSIAMGSVAVGSPAKVIKKRYTGDWDFSKVERIQKDGVPVELLEHARKRGQLISEFTNSEDKVIDIGCGNGIATAILSEKSKNTTGCDYSQDAIAEAKKCYPNIDFLYSNSTNLLFPDGSFTVTILSDIAEHLLPVQLKKTIAEAGRVLKPGGKLILATPLTGKGKNTSTYAHIYEYSRYEMKKILEATFSIVELKNADFGIFVAKK